jgi:hypothetical protein
MLTIAIRFSVRYDIGAGLQPVTVNAAKLIIKSRMFDSQFVTGFCF